VRLGLLRILFELALLRLGSRQSRFGLARS
jgi:hypothetical protein